MSESYNLEEDLLIIDSTERSSDLFYLTNFHAHDPIVFLRSNGKRYLLMNELEYGRAKKESSVDEILSYTEFSKRAQQAKGEDNNHVLFLDVLDQLLKEFSLNNFAVPASFPVWYADKLRALKYNLEVKKEPLLPQRVRKSAEEIEKIFNAQSANEQGMQRIIDILQESSVDQGKINWQNKTLSSEILKAEYAKFMLDLGYQVSATIISSAEQTVDPHDNGSGPIFANSPIIIDLFPQHQQNRYWGDMTRTVVKGKASEEIAKIWHVVKDAQSMAMDNMLSGVRSDVVHGKVEKFFEDKGYASGFKDGKYQGFIHGTGHGIGLDIHELPRFSRFGEEFQVGHVVTVEPGLYYPGIGGVRIEDIVVIEKEGPRNLNNFAKFLEIE